jgi:uncharacterized protein (DUF305 family)
VRNNDPGIVFTHFDDRMMPLGAPPARSNDFTAMTSRRRACAILPFLVGVAAVSAAQPVRSHDSPPMTSHECEASTSTRPPAGPFVIDSSRTSQQLLAQSMAVMSRDMRAAPMSGNPDRDFAAMMIPHHQGAIDMAKVEVLYGKDPALRRLAQEIIVTQESEIAVMRRQLLKDSTPATPSR